MKRALLSLLLVAIGALSTAAVYEYENRYENCILRSMAGVPANAAAVILRTCRELRR